MAMKRFTFFSRKMLQQRFGQPERLGPLLRATLLWLLAAYALFLLWLLFTTLVPALVAPKPILPEQITARQASIDTKTLNAVLQFDAKKHESSLTAELGDPFSPGP